ncbi:SpaH/EbpB family LPXTG-anchored major pilin [Faecalicatena sp. BF-R-105]|jgi:fimbrial isopeptide formation D2 family protein/LPXTG-motif cell wall-anchored protein|nr:SpaH/EbpB family LPXTG-anchored major pilin [Faecalicatena sp. BF-R-105]
MKKLVSRFMAVLMAMTMILSMSMTAFAAEAPKGTLTVNNTVAGKTLDLYQIFTATKNGDNVAYTLNSAYEGFFQNKITGASKLTGEALSEKAYAYVKEQVGDDGSKGATFAKDILGWILSASGETKTAVESTHSTADTADTKTVIDNLVYGYYVVYPLGATDTSTAPGNETVKSVTSLVNVTDTTVTINMKSNYPTVVKKVNDKNADDVNIGDTVTYTLTSKVPDMTGYTSYVFNFKDTLAKGLTFGSITSVKIGDVTINADTDGTKAENTYTLTTKNNEDGTTEIKIEMNKFLASNANKAGQEIKVTYTATLNKDAVTGFDPNTNKATVEYSNKPGTNEKGESEPSIVDVHTFDFTIFKYYLKDETQTALANAEFELYKANTAGNAADTDAKINIVDEGKGVYRQATADEAKVTGFTSAKIVSDDDGKVLVKGLEAGTYYLRETKAPEGYNKLLSDIKVEIKPVYDKTTGKLTSYSVDYTYNGKTTNGAAITNKTDSPEVAVENKTGAQLPSTGSKGALMVTLAGIVLFGALTASKAFGKKKANN